MYIYIILSYFGTLLTMTYINTKTENRKRRNRGNKHEEIKRKH